MTITDERHGSEERAASPRLERKSQRRESWRGFFHAIPAYVYLILFFVLPLIIVFVFSFANRGPTGKPLLEGWNVDSWIRLGEPLVRTIVTRSVVIAVLNTVLCLLIGYQFAYWIATRAKQRTRTLLLILVLIPFWSNFLVRTYAWRMLLDSDGYITQLGELVSSLSGWVLTLFGSGAESCTVAFICGWDRLLFTAPAVFLGLLYGYLPFMVLPLYAAIERIDWSLVEAARDLYADGWTAFRKVTWPLSRPGVIAGSILVFIPSLGAYVTPRVLGGGKKMMIGNFIELQFGAGRNWPLGSALALILLLIVGIALIFYVRASASENKDG